MRTWIETVKPWPAIAPNQFYDARVADVKKGTERNTMAVSLEFLTGEQASRIIPISLPLPIKPEGITASFFRSAGCDVAPDARIAPQSAIDRCMKCCFHVDGDSITPAEFVPSDKEESK
jgi:hypothetical protein